MKRFVGEYGEGESFFGVDGNAEENWKAELRCREGPSFAAKRARYLVPLREKN